MDIKIIASGSGGNCYRVSDGKTALLLDAGVSIRQIREGCGFRLGEVRGCLVTHSHKDHGKAVGELLKTGVPVYMPKGEIAALGLERHHRLYGLEGSQEEYESFTIGTFTVLPFRAEHDTPEPVGYLMASAATGEKLLYFTDTYYLRYRFTGLTHIIGECNYSDELLWEKIQGGDTAAARAKRLFATHMSLDNFLGFLRASDLSRLRQIYICHMSDSHGDEAKIREAVQRLTGAEVYVC